jgi:hypothetical protein
MLLSLSNDENTSNLRYFNLLLGISMLPYVGLCMYVHTHTTSVTVNQTTHHCVQHRTSTTRHCCKVGAVGIASATHTV